MQSAIGKPIPQWLEILIAKRQQPAVLIKLDGLPQADFRLLNAARDACAAGEVECDHGALGVNRLRPQQNGFRFLYALNPPDRIGQMESVKKSYIL